MCPPRMHPMLWLLCCPPLQRPSLSSHCPFHICIPVDAPVPERRSPINSRVAPLSSPTETVSAHYPTGDHLGHLRQWPCFLSLTALFFFWGSTVQNFLLTFQVVYCSTSWMMIVFCSSSSTYLLTWMKQASTHASVAIFQWIRYCSPKKCLCITHPTSNIPHSSVVFLPGQGSWLLMCLIWQTNLRHGSDLQITQENLPSILKGKLYQHWSNIPVYVNELQSS